MWCQYVSLLVNHCVHVPTHYPIKDKIKLKEIENKTLIAMKDIYSLYLNIILNLMSDMAF